MFKALNSDKLTASTLRVMVGGTPHMASTPMKTEAYNFKKVVLLVTPTLRHDLSLQQVRVGVREDNKFCFFIDRK